VLRKILLNLHIYGGLLCFSYLILFGLSTLNFNHPFAFTQSPGKVTTWTQPMPLSEVARTDGKSGAEALRIQNHNNEVILHALGSFAAPPYGVSGAWTGPDSYHAHVVRLGKVYELEAHPARGTATITQTRSGFWQLVRDIHGAYGAFPDSWLASTWAWYTDLCTVVLILAALSGVYLWTRRRRERRVGLVLLGVAGVVSIALMLLITFRE
jgi:hypothetical protein